MTRHTSNRHNKKNSVALLLPVQQESHSRYQSLHYWVSVMVGLLSVGLVLQRFRGVMPVNAVSPSFTAVTLPHDSSQISYGIQFSNVAPFLLSSAVMYQRGNSAIGVLGSLPLWFATPVVAQAPDISIVVPEFRVNSIVTGTQWSPAVSSLSTGEWVVVWRGLQTVDFDIYAQRYAMNGSVLGTEFRVNSIVTGIQESPALSSLSNGEWVVVWHSSPTGNYDIYAQRYAMNGSVQGAEFRVNSIVTGNQWSPAVSSLSNGEWVVVWQGDQTANNDIYAQRYATNGSVLGSEFRVNSNLAGTQDGPAVASSSNGEWVVAWHGTQTGDFDIYAQRYAMNGSVLGAEFRVNSIVTGIQGNPAVVSLSTSEWVVVWAGSQTGNDDIYAQRYAMNGSVLGSEFRVNSATSGAQQYPKVASLSTGECMVVWQGSQTGNPDIYGSIFSTTAPLATPAPSGIATSALPTTVKSTVTTQASSTSSPPLTTTTDNSATLSTTSQASPTLSSAATTQVSSTLSTLLSTTTNHNSVKPPAITSSLDVFTSSLSAGMTVTTATINQTSTAPTTPPLVTATDANSGVSGVVIGAAVGGSVVGLAACLGIIGFYAYRKKSRAGQANHSAVSEVSTSLKTIEQASAQSASEYAQVNLKEANQSDNFIPVSDSPYGRIDEVKKQEKEYDHAPTF